MKNKSKNIAKTTGKSFSFMVQQESEIKNAHKQGV
jgi:hypothetical protein